MGTVTKKGFFFQDRERWKRCCRKDRKIYVIYIYIKHNDVIGNNLRNVGFISAGKHLGFVRLIVRLRHCHCFHLYWRLQTERLKQLDVLLASELHWDPNQWPTSVLLWQPLALHISGAGRFNTKRHSCSLRTLSVQLCVSVCVCESVCRCVALTRGFQSVSPLREGALSASVCHTGNTSVYFITTVCLCGCKLVLEMMNADVQRILFNNAAICACGMYLLSKPMKGGCSDIWHHSVREMLRQPDQTSCHHRRLALLMLQGHFFLQCRCFVNEQYILYSQTALLDPVPVMLLLNVSVLLCI